MKRTRFRVAKYVMQVILLGISLTCYGQNQTGAKAYAPIPDSSSQHINNPGTRVMKVEGLVVPASSTSPSNLPACPLNPVCADINGAAPSGATATAGSCPDTCKVTRSLEVSPSSTTVYIPAVCPQYYVMEGYGSGTDWDIVDNSAPVMMPYPITSVNSLESYQQKGYDCKLVPAGPVQAPICTYAFVPSPSATVACGLGVCNPPSPSSLGATLPLPSFPGIVNSQTGNLEFIINGAVGEFLEFGLTLWMYAAGIANPYVSPGVLSGAAIAMLTSLQNENNACVTPPMTQESVLKYTCHVKSIPASTASTSGLIGYTNSLVCNLTMTPTTGILYYLYHVNVGYWQCSQPVGYIKSNYLSPNTVICGHVKQVWYKNQAPVSH